VRIVHALFGVALTPLVLAAQATQAAKAAPTSEPLPEAQQIAAAVLALPVEFRESARVLGYRSGNSKLVPLREGSGAFTCLAADPKEKDFHVACYHKSMEPFMARGRELRASGVTGEKVDTVRFAEVKSGKIVMPKQPASLYQLFGGTFDPATGTATGSKALFVIYIPGATSATTGLSDKPVQGSPWLMFPGTPKAHIMLSPKM
jgi:hypothetical protein